jgi:hypothetical protein
MNKGEDEREAVDLEARGEQDDGDFSDMLSEMRILLPGAQMLSAFLIILPFNGGFAQIVHSEKLLFLATFFLSLTSLVLLSAPAIQHRLMRPPEGSCALQAHGHAADRRRALALAIALVLGTDLVISEVFGTLVGTAMAGLMALLIACAWWLLPMYLKRRL